MAHEPQMSFDQLAKHLAPEVAKHLPAREIDSRNELSPEEVLEVKITLRVVKWMAGVIMGCLAGITGLLYVAVSDHINYGNTKDQVQEMKQSMASMQSSNSAMQSSQIDLGQKVDHFGQLIQNLDRRVAAHNKAEDQESQ